MLAFVVSPQIRAWVKNPFQTFGEKVLNVNFNMLILNTIVSQTVKWLYFLNNIILNRRSILLASVDIIGKLGYLYIALLYNLQRFTIQKTYFM